MNGRELAERIVASRPGIKVLFMSGYTEDAILHRHVLEFGAPFLQKPIMPEPLARKVRQVLDADSAPPPVPDSLP
jgi:CheY-like chemotaxis protein